LDFDLERFHAGDDAMFAELVRCYSPRLLPLLRRYADTTTDAYDLLQEVWLRVFSKRRSFDGRGSFLGWLLTVSRNVGMTTVRKRAREAPADRFANPASDSDPDTGLLGEELRDAVLALPERERHVVILRLVEGMSTAETARRLQCAEGTVKATLHHATQKLRLRLKEAVK
jgi:RNA polymerase sigma-70 factor (ECF subfamily)